MAASTDRVSVPTLVAVECSTDACSVALSCGGQRYERLRVQPREHHRLLLPLLQELLAEASVDLKQVDALAYGAGPGSFTGLRLAVGIVQGLAFARQKPVIPVSSLAAAALACAEERQLARHTVLVATDARMGDVYLGAYRVDAQGFRGLDPDRLLPQAELERTVRDRYLSAGDVVKVGNGWSEGVDVFPRAATVLTLAQVAYAAGQCLNAREAHPVYLREEVNWQKWQRKSSTPPLLS